MSQASKKKRSRAKPSTAIDLIQSKASDKDSESEEDDELREVEGPSASKKTKTSGGSSDEPRVTIYPILLKPCAPVVKYRKNKIPPPEEVVKSPFFITYDSSMNSFLELLANRLNTTQFNINKDQIQWKPEKPKNAQRKPLVDEDGFSAMLASIRGSKRDAERVVNVYLPPPKIPETTASDDKVQ